MTVHRAPRNHLPGDAAGGRPGWDDRLLSLVNGAEREKADRRGAGMRNWPARIMVVSDIGFRRLLRQAADARGMSASGYMRRATCAFIASDLGVPFEQVCALTPRPATPDGPIHAGQAPSERPLNNPGRQVDDGSGFGVWHVVGQANEGAR